MLIIKEMIENEFLLKQILECGSDEAMLRHMIADSFVVNVDELGSKIEAQKRITKNAIADYVKQNKEGLLMDVKTVKSLSFDFNSVDMIDRINSLEGNISDIETKIIKPYENLSANIMLLEKKAEQVRLMSLLQNLGTYYEYGSDFASINDPYIIGK